MDVERFQFRVGDGCRLEGVVATPREVRAFAVAVPLIGGTGPQQVALFRSLVRSGVQVASFSYRGHRASEGTFWFGTTVTDTVAAVEALTRRVARPDLPFHMLASSYGTVPMLLSLGRHAEWDVSSFVAVSGFPDPSDLLVLFRGFLSDYVQASGAAIDEEDLERRVAADGAALKEAAFRRMLREYLAARFPSVRVTAERFEVLEYRRVNLVHSLLEYRNFFGQDLSGLRLECPSLWVYARHDDVLGLEDAADHRRYRRRVLKVAPRATFYEAEMDHWGRGPGREAVTARMADFLIRQPSSRGGKKDPQISTIDADSEGRNSGSQI